MNIFNVISLCGGLAFFLFGMNVMSNGLEKLAGGKLEVILKKATSSPFKSFLLGLVITCAVQSSSAVTVMLVGLVNSGIMQLIQSVGIIMGSNIGSTLTAWILTMAGIESDNFFLSLLKPESFSPILALIGIFMIMASKNAKKNNIGSILVGFAVLMYGMDIMKDAMAPISPILTPLLTTFESNPIFGVAFGAIFTALIQSSAASVGILQALSLSGGITYGIALPIIMGQNIGTCISAILSCIGTNKNAKRVSVVHVSFNLFGTTICMVLLYGLNAIFNFSFLKLDVNPVTIAMCHSIFNIFTTVIFFPFQKFLVKIAEFVIKNKTTDEEKYVLIDKRLLKTPSFAISECHNITVKMAQTAKKSILSALNMIWNYDNKGAEKINNYEDKLDLFEDELGSFLVKISTNDITEKDSRTVSMMLHTIGDFERIGDHALNLLNTSKEINEKNVTFSGEAKAQLDVAIKALEDIISTTFTAFCMEDIELAKNVEPLEQVIDSITATIKSDHIERLQKGDCSIENGFILSDILNNIERVSDHCSNIAVAMIELSHNNFDTHKYLNSVKLNGNEFYREKFTEYSEMYKI